ncbi:MAG: hypothetical protein ACXV5B_08315 [Halobacteriota archaeon]
MQVGRWVGLNTTLKLRDIESCAQHHMDNVDVVQDVLQFYAGSQYAPSGYAGVFPKGDHALNVGLGMLGSKITDRRPIDYLNEFVADKFPDGQPVELVVGGVPVSDALATIVSNGLLLVGGRCTSRGASDWRRHYDRSGWWRAGRQSRSQRRAPKRRLGSGAS